MKLRYEVRNKLEVFYTGGPIAWHPDGSYLICACSTEIKFIYPETGRVFKTYPEDGELITALAFTPDGLHLFSSSRSLIVKKWNLQSDECVWSFRPHVVPVSDINIHLNGSLVAFGSSDRVISVYDVHRNYRTHTFKGHNGMILKVLFHPSEAELFSCGIDGMIRVWDLKSSKLKTTLKGHANAVTSLSFAENGRALVSAGRDNIIILWRIKDYSKWIEFPVFESIEDVLCLPESFMNINTVIKKQQHSQNPLFLILTGGEKGLVRLWRSDNGSCILTQKQDSYLSEICALDYSAESNQLMIAHGDCSIEFTGLIRTESGLGFGHQRFLMGHLDEITDLSFLDASQFAVSSNSANILIFNIADLNCSKILTGHKDTVLCLISFHFENQVFLASGSKDQTIRIWDVETGTLLNTIRSHGAAVTALAASRKVNGVLISVSGDKLVKSWKIKDAGREIKALSGVVAHNKDINCVDISPNDHFIATGSMDKTIKILTLPNLVSELTLTGHKRGVWSVQFSKVEKILVSSSADLTLRVWSLKEAGVCLRTFEGHNGSIMQAHFISNSTQIISCGGDGMIKLWNIKTSENIATFDDHEDRVWSMKFQDEEEKIMISGGSDSQLIVWEDVTEKDKEQELKTQQEQVLANQNLTNAIQLRDYSLAAKLAFTLDHPRKLLSLLKSNLDSEEHRSMFQAIVDSLETEERIKKCLEYIRDWNTNARHCREAQVLLRLVLDVFPPHKLTSISGIEAILEAIESYTSRHFNRLQKLHQSAYLVDYALDALNVLKDEI